jgi:hypothetical protein
MSSSPTENIKKITAIVFFDLEDGKAKDPSCAGTRMEVEVGGPTSTINQFESSYFFYIATPQYLQRVLSARPEGFCVIRPLIVVERLDSESAERALNSILDRIDEFGLKDAVVLAQEQI